MDLHLLFHSVLMHVSAAMIILIYLPLSIPVKLFMWAFVKPFRKEDLRGKVVLITGASSGIGEELAYQYAEKGACLALVARRKQALDLVANAGVWSICRFDEVTDITAFTKLMDVNFWGSVYPTYYALPHLKASKGKLIVSSSIAGTVGPARTSFYNATKAAQLKFYETLRSELGSEVGVTILTPRFVESEITKGKVIQKGGEVAVDEEARDAQIGVFPVGHVETLCKVALDAIRKGNWYVTWPSLYRPVPLVALLTPEVFDWQFKALYNAKEGTRPLSQRMLEATGAKRLFPPSLRHHPGIKTEKSDFSEYASSNV
ncbi:hypothetical protein PR202_gb08600 [Eleusine coracana subsp. coracana]|uniref:Uncharacterized protein n=1 Tax=Eleusine coracana subsp. coracana TaxID=191504 RepID=A0AAV5ECN4_ELECO|nr:hypothetical protein PR202_gb08600 [Eleusine coracana subsp. coracana]